MNVTLEVSDKRVADLLCGAFEGGSGYWANIVKRVPAPAGYKLYYPPQTYPHVDYPMNGGALVIADMLADKNDAGKQPTHTVDRAAIERGIQVFANLKPGEGGHHFGDWRDENDDAATADVFLQCCVFGEIIYG